MDDIDRVRAKKDNPDNLKIQLRLEHHRNQNKMLKLNPIRQRQEKHVHGFLNIINPINPIKIEERCLRITHLSN